jgi:aminoglycoside 3-N-acetyltransferase
MSKKVLMPSFTYKTMVTPLDGPENNGMTYGSSPDLNLMAEIYSPGLPVDPTIGALAERFRQHPQAKRSMHPILSFSAVNLDIGLEKQTPSDPLAPIGYACDAKGWVLLLGVNQTVNTAIHYAEKLAGRRQFVRWALTEEGIMECGGFPGCSDGFESISPMLQDFTRKVNMNGALIQAIPLNFLIHTVQATLTADPLALLCDRVDCERCATVRNDQTINLLQAVQ